MAAVPGRAPEVAGQHVGEELQVSDVEMTEVGGRGTGDILMAGKIEDSDTWQTLIPPVRAGVHCDVGGGSELQESDTVAEVDGLNPPENVGEEGGVRMMEAPREVARRFVAKTLLRKRRPDATTEAA